MMASLRLAALTSYLIAICSYGGVAATVVTPSILSTCLQIQTAVSSSSVVSLPGTPLYLKDNEHWMLSSSQLSTCSVEPGSASDLSIIIKILGQGKVPFGIKGGGHTGNVGFSSTTGVQIAMFRFSEVNYDASSNTVDIGMGLVWDDVYTALQPLSVNVVGGRVTGVGVGGFALGGGYSWLSNQYGLTIDNVIQYNLVLPNGTITTASSTVNSDLFFGLRGGFNNFGIVYSMTLKAYPQGQVWGGLITYTESHIPQVTAAVANFSANNTDPKAAIITAYNFLLGQPGISQLIFYDGPSQPAGIFDQFLAIPAFTTDVSTRSFLSLVQSSPSNATEEERGVFQAVSVLHWSPGVLAQVANQSAFWGNKLQFDTGTFISYGVEPFLSSYFDNSKGGAYPHSSSKPLVPLLAYFAYLDSGFDATFQEAVAESADAIVAQAVSEGQDVGGANQLLYGNYALANTPLQQLYGSNLPTLQNIKSKYDPGNVMALCGGFKI